MTKIDPIVDAAEPVIDCRGVRAIGSASTVASADTAMRVFGRNFAPSGTEVDADSSETSDRLAETCVEVNGARAPLVAVRPEQVEFRLPPGTPAGIASVRVVRGCDTPKAQSSEPEHFRVRF